MIEKAAKDLSRWAEKYQSCILAFSGGLDSTLLLYLLNRYTRIKITAITLKSPYTPPWEIQEAEEFCRHEKIKHEVRQMEIITEIKDNPPNRCYLCKSHIFYNLKIEAKKRKIDIVVDGTNFDDNPEERPGMKALIEHEIESPLRIIRFGKKEIRNMSRCLNLPTAEKSSCSCLLTRLPFKHEIKVSELNMIAAAEQYLHNLLTDNVRVRVDEKSALVEIGNGMLKEINPAIEKKLYGFGLKKITYTKRD